MQLRSARVQCSRATCLSKRWHASDLAEASTNFVCLSLNIGSSDLLQGRTAVSWFEESGEVHLREIQEMHLHWSSFVQCSDVCVAAKLDPSHQRTLLVCRQLMCAAKGGKVSLNDFLRVINNFSDTAVPSWGSTAAYKHPATLYQHCRCLHGVMKQNLCVCLQRIRCFQCIYLTHKDWL